MKEEGRKGKVRGKQKQRAGKGSKGKGKGEGREERGGRRVCVQGEKKHKFDQFFFASLYPPSSSSQCNSAPMAYSSLFNFVFLRCTNGADFLYHHAKYIVAQISCVAGVKK